MRFVIKRLLMTKNEYNWFQKLIFDVKFNLMNIFKFYLSVFYSYGGTSRLNA